MSINGNKRKDTLLGESHGAATHRLRKLLIFTYAKRCGDLDCFQCGKPIESIDALSIEHKKPWMQAEQPRMAFYDLDNIAFSHLRCNIGAATPVNKRHLTPEDRRQAKNKSQRESKKRLYTPEKRRRDYLEKGW